MGLLVFNIVNSIIGKRGNIGLRTYQIISELEKRDIGNISYSRGSVVKLSRKNHTMGLAGIVPRLLNAYRIYVSSRFNHRKFDIRLFEFFFKRSYINSSEECKVAHLWEFSPKIIDILKKDGWIVILDIPIAPTSTSKKICDSCRGVDLVPHDDIALLELDSFRASDRIICPSNFVKDELIDLGIEKEKIDIVPFGSNVHLNSERVFNKNYRRDGVDFCFAGSINKRKGVEFLLEAWSEPCFQNDRLHLCGRLYPEISELLNSYKFDNVILPGFVDTYDYFQKCDVYVFPSLLEGSSKSIYEAMSCSMPCIVTHNSGSVVEHEKEGFLVKACNTPDLTNAMKKIKMESEKIETMGRNSFKKSQIYTWEKYAKSVVEIYKNLN